jgi:hypothetical protein
MRSSQINRSLSQNQAKPKPYSPPKVYDKYIFEKAFANGDIAKYILSFDIDSYKRLLDLSLINKRFQTLLSQHYQPSINEISPKLKTLIGNQILPMDLANFKKSDWFKLAQPYFNLMKATSPEFQREVLMDVLRTIQQPRATTQTEEKKAEQVASLQSLAVEVKTGLISSYHSLGRIVALDVNTQRDHLPSTVNHAFMRQMPEAIAGQTRGNQYAVKSFLVCDIFNKTIVAAAFKRPDTALSPAVIINIENTDFENESIATQRYYARRQKQVVIGILCCLALTAVGFIVCQKQKDNNPELSKAFGILGGIMTLLTIFSARVSCHYRDQMARNTLVSELAQRNRAASRAAAARLNVSTEQREQLQRPLLNG